MKDGVIEVSHLVNVAGMRGEIISNFVAEARTRAVRHGGGVFAIEEGGYEFDFKAKPVAVRDCVRLWKITNLRVKKLGGDTMYLVAQQFNFEQYMED